MYCTNCGTQVRDDSRYCFNCGAALVLTSESDLESMKAQTSSSHEGVFGAYQTVTTIVTTKMYNGKARAAGILQIIASVMWGVITLIQITDILTNGMSTESVIVAIWNTVMTIGGITEGVKLLNGHKKECQAAIRSTVIGTVWYLVQSIIWHPFVILFMFFEIATLVLLLNVTRSSSD